MNLSAWKGSWRRTRASNAAVEVLSIASPNENNAKRASGNTKYIARTIPKTSLKTVFVLLPPAVESARRVGEDNLCPSIIDDRSATGGSNQIPTWGRGISYV